VTAQMVPMTVDEALKAAETYTSGINGTMVDVLAREVKRLRALQPKQEFNAWTGSCPSCGARMTIRRDRITMERPR